MFIEKDTFYSTGKSHQVCEDYVVANCRYPIICLSDGCSSSKDTDVGSRLIVRSALDDRHINGQFFDTLKLYCNETAKDFWEVKEQRTNRAFINLGDIIFDYIQFDSTDFNKLLDKYKQKVIVETKGAVEESVIHKGFKYDFGSGGIHGAIKSGVYKSDSEYIIKSCDVASLYPSLAVVNRLYPEHLGESFCTVYKRILDLRVLAKSNGDSVMSDGFKLALNSVYGKSNDVNSFLYDPKYTMSITINGQLLLTMLAESLYKIPDSTMIMINTDGIEIKYPEFMKSFITKYVKIGKKRQILY